MNESIRHTDIQPNTPEWLELRTKYRTASEAAIVCGKSPFTSVEKFKMIKAGLAKQFYSKAMQLGHETEEATRQWASEALGMPLEEAIFTRGRYLASLDGYHDGTVVEIKASSHTYGMVKDGYVPIYYHLQILQQLYCSGAHVAYLVAYCPKTGQYAMSGAIHYTDGDMDEIEAAWDAFDAMPVPEGDVDASDNTDLRQLFDRYAAVKAQADEVEMSLDEIKAKILSYASPDRSVACAGYRIEYRKPSTKVDYKKAATAARLDLAPYTTTADAPSYVLKMAPSPFAADDDE